jgi:hypothetical protein
VFLPEGQWLAKPLVDTAVEKACPRRIVRQDYEEVQIAVGTSVTPRRRAEEVDTFRVNMFSQPPYHLANSIVPVFGHALTVTDFTSMPFAKTLQAAYLPILPLADKMASRCN